MNLTVAAQDEAIHLEIMEGDGAINNIRSSHTKEPVVRVEDANNRGVPGAVVTFLVPSAGPGVVFADAATSLTLTTDDRGEVVPRGLHPNRNVGPFQIRVTASAHGMTANAAISQTNVDPDRTLRPAKSSSWQPLEGRRRPELPWRYAAENQVQPRRPQRTHPGRS